MRVLKDKEAGIQIMKRIILFVFCSGGILITVTGTNMDSVAEPIMVVTVIEGNRVSVYYQVQRILRQIPNVWSFNRIHLNCIFVKVFLHRHVP